MESSTKPSVLQPELGQQWSTVSTTKEAVLLFLSNLVIGGKQSTGSNASIQRQDGFQISAAGTLGQEHFL